MESDALVLTFTFHVPTQADLDTLNFPSPVNLKIHTVLQESELQPQKHVVKFELPTTVIRENYSCRKTDDFIAFQFAVGRTTNFEMKIPGT